MIGEGGSTLSGGEKQRISIARAILKDAPIVILDEATSSVDPENQHILLTAINELTKGKTLIIIAHRLSTIRNADQIVVLDGGRIVQQGTHKTLIQQDGSLRRYSLAHECIKAQRVPCGRNFTRGRFPDNGRRTLFAFNRYWPGSG